MAERGRPKQPLVVSAEQRAELERWARRPTTAQALALRSRVVLGCAEGLDNRQVAARLGRARGDGRQVARAGSSSSGSTACSTSRGRAPAHDHRRAGRGGHRARPSRRSRPTRPTGRPARWPGRRACARPPFSRIWRAFGLQPHRAETLQALDRPAVHREGPRRRRAVPRPARAGGRAVRRREDPDPGPGPLPAHPADAAGHPRAAQPRLRPPRHDQPVRGARRGHRQGHRRPATGATARASSSSSSSASTRTCPASWTST